MQEARRAEPNACESCKSERGELFYYDMNIHYRMMTSEQRREFLKEFGIVDGVFMCASCYAHYSRVDERVRRGGRFVW